LSKGKSNKMTRAQTKKNEELLKSFSEALEAIQERPVPDWDQ
jgi:hypothetical protein